MEIHQKHALPVTEGERTGVAIYATHVKEQAKRLPSKLTNYPRTGPE
jgi:hypothetical protein